MILKSLVQIWIYEATMTTLPALASSCYFYLVFPFQTLAMIFHLVFSSSLQRRKQGESDVYGANGIDVTDVA